MDSDSQIRSCGLFVRIHFVYSSKDSWRFVRIFKIRENRSNLLKILRICGQESNQIFWNSGFVDHDTNQTFLKLWNCDTNLLEVSIHVHDLIGIHGFARWIHRYTIPWYNSRNLTKTPRGHLVEFFWKISMAD
jgi:hypothetical protein